MRHRILPVAAVLATVALVLGLAWFSSAGPPAQQALSRREGLLGLLTLGTLALAAFGFDLRDWS